MKILIVDIFSELYQLVSISPDGATFSGSDGDAEAIGGEELQRQIITNYHWYGADLVKRSIILRYSTCVKPFGKAPQCQPFKCFDKTLDGRVY